MGRGRFKLTWQAGAGRRGRWKKMYKGRILYFDGGRGKSDSEAYALAVAEFDRQKVLIDSELHASRPHRRDYEEAIAEWEQVLLASREARDNPAMIVSAAKIDELRKRMSSRNPPPVSKRFDYPVRRLGLNAGQIVSSLTQSDVAKSASLIADSVLEELDIPEEDQEYVARVVQAYAGDAIWKERLAKTQSAPEDVAQQKSLKTRIGSYLAKRRPSGITATHYENIRRRLEYLQRVLGPGIDASTITGRHLDDLHQALLKDCESKRFSRNYAADVMKTIKTFVRWLHEVEILPHLPRNLTSKSLRIDRETPIIEAYSIEQVQQYFVDATPQLQLYMLLALNCGMTQIDISDLKPESVNWALGTLTRKRGKTANSARVPTVTYKLWTRTVSLLKQLRSEGTDPLLVTAKGETLCGQGYRDDQFVRRDAVGDAFEWHRKRQKLSGNFRMFKKTSASLLRDHPEFNGIEPVFLDHAPRSISDKHYAKVPETLLARGLDWLEAAYGFNR